MVERAGICYVIFFVLLLSALHNGSKRLEAMDDALHPLRKNLFPSRTVTIFSTRLTMINLREISSWICFSSFWFCTSAGTEKVSSILDIWAIFTRIATYCLKSITQLATDSNSETDRNFIGKECWIVHCHPFGSEWLWDYTIAYKK